MHTHTGMSNATTPDAAPATKAVTATQSGIGTLLIPVLASTVLTLGVVGGSLFYVVRTWKLSPAASATVVTPPPVIVMAPPASHVTALEPILVNLSDVDGRSYLRAGVSLRIKDEEKKDSKAVDAVGTELRDTTLTVLSRQTSDKLLTPGGREDLKKELEREYKQRNTEIPVLEVFFTDFLVQRG